MKLTSGRLLFLILLAVAWLAACRPAPAPQVEPTLVSRPVLAPASKPTQAAMPKPALTPGLPLPGGGGQRGSVVTYVPVEGIGKIAVRLDSPKTPRYPDGAGILLHVGAFFTPPKGFTADQDVTRLGLIQVAYLWPGLSDPSGARSQGTFDYGGPDSLRALAEVARFAAGQIPDEQGRFIQELTSVPALVDQVGLYAFSHPGIAAVNLLAQYGQGLPQIKYLVGRENPTLDLLSCVEVGHFDENQQAFLNPLYRYPQSYSPTDIKMDYSSLRWDPQAQDSNDKYIGRPYFDLNGDGQRDQGDYTLGSRVPSMWDRRYYSVALTTALRDNRALSQADWPPDLATPEEAARDWPSRSSVLRYPELKSQTPDLKVMLVFARQDHVQPAPDKPHIHQAYDGFHNTAGLWTRLNFDAAYLQALAGPAVAYAEHPANSQPADWLEIEAWAYANQGPGGKLAPLAAVAEMADRTHAGRWEADLDAPLVQYALPAGKAPGPAKAPLPSPGQAPGPNAQGAPRSAAPVLVIVVSSIVILAFHRRGWRAAKTPAP